MIATAKAERDKVVNWLALALVVDNGVDPDYAMQLGGILPDDAVIPMRGIYSQATIDAMGELKADGLSFKAIGDMYQISSHAVYRLLKKGGTSNAAGSRSKSRPRDLQQGHTGAEHL